MKREGSGHRRPHGHEQRSNRRCHAVRCRILTKVGHFLVLDLFIENKPLGLGFSVCLSNERPPLQIGCICIREGTHQGTLRERDYGDDPLV